MDDVDIGRQGDSFGKTASIWNIRGFIIPQTDAFAISYGVWAVDL